MIVLLKLIVLTSIWVLGLKIATQENMVLEKLGRYGKKKTEEGKKIFEAIIVCEWCMPSLHSVVGYTFAITTGMVSMSWTIVILYPLVVMGSSFVSGMAWLVYEILHRKFMYLRNVETLTHWEMKDRQQQHKNQNNGKKIKQ